MDRNFNRAVTATLKYEGGYSSLYVASGSTGLTIANNSFGSDGSGLGDGKGTYGCRILGGTRFLIANNSADGVATDWDVSGLSDSSCDNLWFAFTPSLTSSGGGAFTTVTGSFSVSGSYQA